jgi:2,4-dienoyl-CoA reductase-like NADH-dependent reductase (Old Yellow Enzyme family)
MVIWTPTTVGALELPHRLVMAPMTRDRSRADGVPSDLNREYYGKDFCSACMNGNYSTSPEEESATGRPDRDPLATVARKPASRRLA